MSSFMMTLQALIDGLLIGGVYAVIAIGLSLAFGVMRIVNWAHGELLMLSIYISYFIFTWFGIDPYLLMFLTAVLMAGFGYILQRFVISNMLAREKEVEPISVLLFTAGLGVFLSNLALVIFKGNPRTATTVYTGRSIHAGMLYVSVPKLISFVIAMGCTVLLYYFLQKSETGRAIRAASQNRNVVTLMGVNIKRLYNIAFAISVGMVGIAGALLLPYSSVQPTSGTTYSFKSFVIIVLGGQGSVIGALISGLLVGIIEKVGTLYFSDTTAQIAVFAVFVLVLLLRPNGLFGRKQG
ncbi:MAG: branched-chain amino acid ABC transporter permease [Lachnospiraceae bacterium]|nr:branched-chain amino acid ABC transporter permease [Lachnospiraceae bacterium]